MWTLELDAFQESPNNSNRSALNYSVNTLSIAHCGAKLTIVSLINCEKCECIDYYVSNAGDNYRRESFLSFPPLLTGHSSSPLTLVNTDTSKYSYFSPTSHCSSLPRMASISDQSLQMFSALKVDQGRMSREFFTPEPISMTGNYYPRWVQHLPL